MATTNCFRNQIRRLTTLIDNQLKYTHLFNPKITPPRQAWVESFVDREKQLLGIVDLHPKIFGVFPRIDHISALIYWQKTYRKIDYISMPTRNELPGGTKKPWPQKGTGRAHHGSVNSPIFKKGGWAHGPRGPTTQFRLKPHFNNVNALKEMLTIKLAQDDIKIVDSIDSYDSEDPKELEKSFEERGWGPSVLIVDHRDIFPQKLIELSKQINHVNLMPTYSVNILSLCKHESLVITLKALREIEDKLLFQTVRVDLSETRTRYRQE